MQSSHRFLFILIIFFSQSALAQKVFTPYYVVIGGFKSEENARKYCDYASEQNLPAVYAYNEERKIFYVYVRATQTKDVADDILSRLQSSSVFKDAWVFNGSLTGGNLVARKSQPAPPSKKQQQPEFQTSEQPKRKDSIKTVEETKSAAVPEPEKPLAEVPRPVGKPFVFKLLNEETGKTVNGLVRLQETEKAMQFRGFNGNETVYVPKPNNRSGKWYVVCHVLGFRQLKRPLQYDNATDFDGASLGSGDEVVIPLQLQRVKRGDYIDMEGVKFYNNTALFSPGSERELDELVAMMEENPDYNIRLHGHTNGNQSRDMISLGNSSDFFTPDVSNEKSFGTAKELSLRRAELVKAYLVRKGIEAERITTKGEGGTQMIFESKGTLAGLNDRVEVEIRKH